MSTTIDHPTPEDQAARVRRRVAASIETSDLMPTDTAAALDISLRQLGDYLDGKQSWNVAQLLLLAQLLGVDLVDWFAPAADEEVAR
ncbi:hypothetical protein [Nocardia donostiensis]|uniref:HTH cro/C1-type domain-containing protein n=1 Tax=Nocardia donostiensis TaxID=1538463 RepID=A0A1W0BCC8_9NOCA|nr:hypothetical protein [Nocardia donostiensis]ONM47172.1 hypothetical protein B0T46_19590 [Nocardia donostiensis]OQS20157.1 hypothetical protein B0T44_11580 [Nocardia donostiensis]